jgi:hypothetical protein
MKNNQALQGTSCLLPDKIKIQIWDILPLLDTDELKTGKAPEVAL